jgi:hypothetical protein
MAKKIAIAGSTFLFTGTLTEFTRSEAESIVKEHRGSVLSGVTAKLNYLVAGSDAGSKLKKATDLGTVKILTEKEFLAMIKKGTTAVKPNKTIVRNEVKLKADLKSFEQLIKKTKGKLEYEDYDGVVLKLIEKVKDRSEDVQFKRRGPFFIYIESENVLEFAHAVDHSVYQRCRYDEDFFKGLSKLTDQDFKIDVWDHESREIHFCKYVNGKLTYASDDEEMWSIDFDGYPYFIKVAKSRGFKKVKNEDGFMDYDADDKYAVIYDLVDLLLNGIGADNIAPSWYTKG